MKKPQKKTLKTAVATVIFLGLLGGLLFGAIQSSSDNPLEGNVFFEDVANKYRY